MLHQLHQEIYVYTPPRNVENNENPLSDLSGRLNAHGQITGFEPNNMGMLQLTHEMRTNGAYSKSPFIEHSRALLFSNSMPITLVAYNSYHISSRGILGERDYCCTGLYIHLRHFEGTDRKDIAFVRRCIDQARFKKVKPESKKK